MDSVGVWLTGSVYRCQAGCDRYVLSHARVPCRGGGGNAQQDRRQWRQEVDSLYVFL